jgi:hypothetical protein
VVLLAVTACAAPRTKPVPDITFAHLSPIMLDVRAIEITSAYQPPQRSPNVEHTMRVPPDAALQRWAQDRLRAQGINRIARFTVVNAPVTVEPLPKRTGFSGAFSIEASERYTMTVEAQIEILDEAGNRLSGTSARVTNARSLEEGVTAEEKELFFHELTSSVMTAFDSDMDRAIRASLRDWVQ